MPSRLNKQTDYLRTKSRTSYLHALVFAHDTSQLQVTLDLLSDLLEAVDNRHRGDGVNAAENVQSNIHQALGKRAFHRRCENRNRLNLTNVSNKGSRSKAVPVCGLSCRTEWWQRPRHELPTWRCCCWDHAVCSSHTLLLWLRTEKQLEHHFSSLFNWQDWRCASVCACVCVMSCSVLTFGNIQRPWRGATHCSLWKKTPFCNRLKPKQQNESVSAWDSTL